MLHIVWLILKFIGIVLGVLLGLLLLLLLLVLFCPVRYQLHAVKESESYREIHGDASVSWLFHLISLRIWYENGRLDKSIRLFGVPVLQLLAWFKGRKKKTEQQKFEIPSKEVPEKETLYEEELSENCEEEAEEEAIEEVLEEDTEEPPIEEPEIPAASEKTWKKTAESPSGETDDFGDPIQKKQNRENPVQRLLHKWKAILGKLKMAYENLEDTKARIQKRLAWWSGFLGHKRTKSALTLAKASVLRVLKHVFPTKISGEVTFGNENPEFMGKVLMFLSITLPFHKNAIRIHPVFDGSNVLLGQVRMKGRVCAIVFVVTAVRLYFDKNIRFVIHRWKNKED